MKGSPTISFAIVFPFLRMRRLKETFHDVFQQRDSSQGRLMLTHGVLYYLFTEFSSFPLQGVKIIRYREFAETSRKLLEAVMSEVDMRLPASYENILALLVAVSIVLLHVFNRSDLAPASYAVHTCKTQLSWTMISAAANLCQTLGYHRYASMKDEPADECAARIHVFWFVYVMDKTIALRLGRVPCIPDWSVSLPLPAHDSEDKMPHMADIQRYWIKLAEIQGQIFERLYSPGAFLRPDSERVQTATQLVDSLNAEWNLRKRVRIVFPGFDSNAGDLFYHADVVGHHSTAALIQRAIRPGADGTSSTCHDDCIRSARAALAAHQACADVFNTKENEELWSGYIHWYAWGLSACTCADVRLLSSPQGRHAGSSHAFHRPLLQRHIDVRCLGRAAPGRLCCNPRVVPLPVGRHRQAVPNVHRFLQGSQAIRRREAARLEKCPSFVSLGPDCWLQPSGPWPGPRGSGSKRLSLCRPLTGHGYYAAFRHGSVRPVFICSWTRSEYCVADGHNAKRVSSPGVSVVES